MSKLSLKGGHQQVEEIKKMNEKSASSGNKGKQPVSKDSATCPVCNQRGDSTHIDEINGNGTFQKLKKAGQTDDTKINK
jgi:hypothetical protein